MLPLEKIILRLIPKIAMNFKISAITAVCCYAIYIFLTLAIVKLRADMKIPLGDGGDKLLQRRIRGHGNFSEFGPFGLTLIFICEANEVSYPVITVAAVMLIIGRAVHGFTFFFEEGTPLGRPCGMFFTMSSLTVCAVALIYKLSTA